MYAPLPNVPFTCVIAWHTVQVMPACAVRSFTSSNFGSSNAPLRNGTGSWHPAHHRDDFTEPSFSIPCLRVSRTLNRYAGLLNELNLCAEWKWSFATSAWHFAQYASIIITSAEMNLPSAVRVMAGSKYCAPSFGPSRNHFCGSCACIPTMPSVNTPTPSPQPFASRHLIRGPARRCATYAHTASAGNTRCSQYTTARPTDPVGNCGSPSSCTSANPDRHTKRPEKNRMIPSRTATRFGRLRAVAQWTAPNATNGTVPSTPRATCARNTHSPNGVV